MMKFQVTQIDFDFEDDNFECPIKEQIEIIDDTKSTIWEVDDEDDLIEEITCATGFCIKSIDYKVVLQDYGPWRTLSPLSE